MMASRDAGRSFRQLAALFPARRVAGLIKIRAKGAPGEQSPNLLRTLLRRPEVPWTMRPNVAIPALRSCQPSNPCNKWPTDDALLDCGSLTSHNAPNCPTTLQCFSLPVADHRRGSGIHGQQE
jgi:hypothetical protein